MIVKQEAVRAARVLRAGAVGVGRRAARVARAARARHGGLRGGARRVRGRVRLAAAPRARRRAQPGVRRAVRTHGVRRRARRAGRAGAAVRGVAGGDGVARGGARRRGGAGRAAVHRVRRHPRVLALHGPRALRPGVGDVDLLPGSAGHRRQRAAHSARGRGRRARCDRRARRDRCARGALR